LVKLFEVDCHLEYARLSLAKIPNLRRVKDAREHLTIAKKMIEEMGYHRWDQDVSALEGLL